MTSPAGADRAWWSGRSSKPRQRRHRRLWWVRFPHAPATLLAALVLLPLGAGGAHAQDSLPPAPVPPADTTAPVPRIRLDRPAGEDTLPAARRPPTSPMGAFWRSLLVPGWGQAKYGRKIAAAGFIAAEGLALGMAFKANQEIGYLEDIGDDARVSAKKQERQDWLFLLAFNHLVSAVEGLVSAHLWDFPGDLRIEKVPGGVRGGLQLPVRVR